MRLALFLLFVVIGLCPTAAFAQRRPPKPPKEDPLVLPADPRLVELLNKVREYHGSSPEVKSNQPEA